jgi:hypothetical protein
MFQDADGTRVKAAAAVCRAWIGTSDNYTNAAEFAQRNSTFFTPKLDRAPYKPVSQSSEGCGGDHAF